MKTKPLIAAIAILPLLGASASAHRLDEYLQATLISIEKDRVHAAMRLVPGVAVSSFVLTSMDTDADGVISGAEQRAYAERVLRDVSLTMDGHVLSPQLISVEFPEVEAMKEGTGEIQIEFSAELPRGGSDRRLIFENHHQSGIAAYLVNCLVPRDKAIRIEAQNRNESQSFYELDYALGGGSPALIDHWRTNVFASLGSIALLFAAASVLLLRLRASGVAKHPTGACPTLENNV